MKPVQNELTKTDPSWNHEEETEWRKSMSWNWLAWS